MGKHCVTAFRHGALNWQGAPTFTTPLAVDRVCSCHFRPTTPVETICSCDLFNTSMERAQHTGASVYCQFPAAAAPAAPVVPPDPPRVMAAASAEPVPAAGLPAVVRPAISRKSCALSQPRCTRICKLWIIFKSVASILAQDWH